MFFTRHQHAQSKLTRLSTEAAKVGLNINVKKTEVMKINSRQEAPIQLHEKNLVETDRFTYLGSVMTTTGGADEDVRSRIGNQATLSTSYVQFGTQMQSPLGQNFESSIAT